MEGKGQCVGSEEGTYCRRFIASEGVWGGMPKQGGPYDGRVQIRYRHDPAPCTVSPRGNELEIMLHTPQRSVTPGQWAVVYDDEDRVLVASNIKDFERLRSSPATSEATA